MVSGGSAGGFLLKSTIISIVLSVLSSRLLKAGTHQADGRPLANVGPTASDGRASLFDVLHSSALFGLTSAAVCVGAVGERENSDWMFSLANESVPEN